MRSTLKLTSWQFQRILLIKPSSLGDIIHALPVLAGLRHRYPDAHIAWLAGSAYRELLEAQPALTEVIPFDRRRYGRVGRSLGVSIGFARFLGALRRRRFDLVIDLQGLFRSGFLAWGSGDRLVDPERWMISPISCPLPRCPSPTRPLCSTMAFAPPSATF